MTISHPTLPPHEQYTDINIELVDATRITRSGAGKVTSVIDVGDPFLKIAVVTKPMHDIDRRPWQRWANGLKGAIHPFLFFDPRRKWPMAHVGGFSGWNGLATLHSVSGRSIMLDGVPDGFTVSEDDHVSFIYNGRYMLAFALGAQTKTAGVRLSFEIEPFVPVSLFPEGLAVVNFYSPKGLFRMTGFTPFSGVSAGPVSFEAVSTL